MRSCDDRTPLSTVRVEFRNDGPAASDIRAEVVSQSPSTVIVAGQISVGNLAAGASTIPEGTITLRHDRTVPFSFTVLVWKFSARPSSGEPVNVDSFVQVTFSPLTLNPNTGTFDTVAKITNVSDRILRRPISLVIAGVSPTGVWNESGQTPNGEPFFAVAAIANRLAPGDTSADVLVQFVTPVAFTHSIFAVLTPAATAPLLTPAERGASLDAVHAKLESLTGLNTADENRVMVAFLLERPEFIEAGTSDEDLTVWARWRDGVDYFILRNRAASAALESAGEILPASTELTMAASASGVAPLSAVATVQSVSSEAGHPTNVPASNQVRLLSSLGPGWKDARSEIRPWLVQQRYNDIGADAHVQSLKSVGGDGVFYLNGHAGTGEGLHPFGFSSATPWSQALDLALIDDFVAGRVVIMSACHDSPAVNPGEEKCRSTAHYGITSAFVQHYWRDFSEYSLVYIDTCAGMSEEAKPFRDALIAKKASVITGWTKNVDEDPADHTVKLVFDRLLGANKYAAEKDRPTDPTGFAQRSFDWISVIDSDCGQHKDPLGQHSGCSYTDPKKLDRHRQDSPLSKLSTPDARPILPPVTSNSACWLPAFASYTS